MLVDGPQLASAELDYIIIGGGTAGLVVAARLSEDANVVVGVIEAGLHDTGNPVITIPGLAGSAISDKRYDWCFKTIPQAGCNQREIVQPRGKILGGSSAINLLIMGRANREEYDAFERLGNIGWNWTEFLKYFKKSETLNYPESSFSNEYGLNVQAEFHGTDGPIKNSFNRFVWKQLHHAYNETLANLNIPNNSEPASGNNVGSTFSTVCIDPSSAARSYSANAYYEAVSHRSNLLLLTGAFAKKILMDTSVSPLVATGVQYHWMGNDMTAMARREVILSAGSLQTPQILELSGIGRPNVLSEFDVKPVLDLPVGENLQDHTYVTSVFESHPNSTTSDHLRDAEIFREQMNVYNTSKEGPFSSTNSAYAFVPLRQFTAPKEADNILASMLSGRALGSRIKRDRLLEEWFDNPKHAQIEFIHRPQMRVGAGQAEPGKKYQTIMTCSMHPLSRGSVHIQSADPFVAPAINPNYFGNPLDLRVMVNAMKFARKISETEPLASTIIGKVVPREDVQTDEQFEQYIRNQVLPVYHPVGTASMLPEEDGGVVDENLIVYGTKNLRVVDASIIPLQLSCHIMATVYAIAEKGADLIKGHQ